MVFLLSLNVHTRKMYEEEKNKKSFYKQEKKECSWSTNASRRIKQKIYFQIWYCKALDA